jgi:hypothetical protein
MTGNGMTIRWIDAAILLGLLEHPIEEVPQWVANLLAQRNLRIQVNNQNAEDDRGTEAFIRMLVPGTVQTFTQTIGYVGLVKLPSLASVTEAINKANQVKA